MVWDGLGWFRCGGVGGWRGKGFEGDDADGDVDVAAKIVKIEKRREEQSRAEQRRGEERREEKREKPRQSHPQVTQRKRDEHIAR